MKKLRKIVELALPGWFMHWWSPKRYGIAMKVPVFSISWRCGTRSRIMQAAGKCLSVAAVASYQSPHFRQNQAFDGQILITEKRGGGGFLGNKLSWSY